MAEKDQSRLDLRLPWGSPSAPPSPGWWNLVGETGLPHVEGLPPDPSADPAPPQNGAGPTETPVSEGVTGAPGPDRTSDTLEALHAGIVARFDRLEEQAAARAARLEEALNARHDDLVARLEATLGQRHHELLAQLDVARAANRDLLEGLATGHVVDKMHGDVIALFELVAAELLDLRRELSTPRLAVDDVAAPGVSIPADLLQARPLPTRPERAEPDMAQVALQG